MTMFVFDVWSVFYFNRALFRFVVFEQIRFATLWFLFCQFAARYLHPTDSAEHCVSRLRGLEGDQTIRALVTV